MHFPGSWKPFSHNPHLWVDRLRFPNLSYGAHGWTALLPFSPEGRAVITFQIVSFWQHRSSSHTHLAGRQVLAAWQLAAHMTWFLEPFLMWYNKDIDRLELHGQCKRDGQNRRNVFLGLVTVVTYSLKTGFGQARCQLDENLIKT